jgi:polyisoprenoid-binding protein YceI
MLSLTLLGLAVGTTLAQPRDTVRVDPERGSRVWIEGSSNVHDWSCRATAFDARAELDPAAAATGQIRRVTVKLSARDLKCGNPKMEHDLYAALKANDRANPSWIIASFNAVTGGDSTTIETQGTVELLGVERYIETRLTTERMSDGTVKARGSVPLRMTDFGVKPPVGLFGLIRSRNEVVVQFELVISPRKPAQ